MAQVGEGGRGGEGEGRRGGGGEEEGREGGGEGERRGGQEVRRGGKGRAGSKHYFFIFCKNTFPPLVFHKSLFLYPSLPRHTQNIPICLCQSLCTNWNLEISKFIKATDYMCAHCVCVRVCVLKSKRGPKRAKKKTRQNHLGGEQS